MKRLTLFTILITISAITGAQQGWTEIAANSDFSIGIDKDSILMNGSTRLVWLITVNKTGPYVGTYTLSRTWFNCATKTYGTRSMLIRSTTTHQVVASYQPNEDQSAHDVSPGSMIDRALDAVC